MTAAPFDADDRVVVLDFETTGLSPNQGDRAIEIGAVRIVGGEVSDRFQALMNPGMRVSPFIEGYTGISNTMLRHEPPCDEVMDRFADFVGDDNMVAHNASFDRRFLDAEFERIDRRYTGGFACSMLIARRVYPDAPNHRLGTLVAYRNLPTDGVYHRALADAEMTAHLWLRMLADIGDAYALAPIAFSLMQRLAGKPKAAVREFLSRTSQPGRVRRLT